MSHNEFLSPEMTPRSWRMIIYCALGFAIYGALLFAELLQTVHLNKIDAQLKMISAQEIQ